MSDIELIQSASEQFIKLMKEHFDVTIEYNRESVKWVDKYITKLANSDANPKARSESLWVIGAWFGETLVHSMDGKWYFDEQYEQWAVKIPFMKDDTSVNTYPFSKVLNQANKGPSESIALLYNNLLMRGFDAV